MMKVLLVLCTAYVFSNAQEVAKGEGIDKVIGDLDTLHSTVKDLEENQTRVLDNYENTLAEREQELRYKEVLNALMNTSVGEIVSLARADHHEHCRHFAVKSLHLHLQHAVFEVNSCTNDFSLFIDNLQSLAISIGDKAKGLGLTLASLKRSLAFINSVGVAKCFTNVFLPFETIIRELADSKATDNGTEAVDRYNKCLHRVYDRFSGYVELTKSNALICVSLIDKKQIKLSVSVEPDTEDATSLPDATTAESDLSDATFAEFDLSDAIYAESDLSDVTTAQPYILNEIVSDYN